MFQALVSVSQVEEGRMWVAGPRTEKYGQTDTSLGLWSECEAVGDHLTAYDGPGVPGAEPPVSLVRLCRGGPVPQIVSSGPDLLLVFRTAPFAQPRSSPYGVTGFELEVEIKFVRSDSNTVMPRDKTTGLADCRFSLSSVRRQAGTVRSISHGLARNQTCTWEFQVNILHHQHYLALSYLILQFIINQYLT